MSLAISEIPARAEPQLAPLDKVRSSIVAVAKTPGFLGFGGETHALYAGRWFAALRLDRKNLAASNIEVAVSTEALEADTPDAMKAAGLGKAPEREKAEKSEAELKSEAGLDVARHPMLRFSGESVTKKSDQELVIKGKLTLRGVTRDIEAAVQVSSSENETLRFRSTLKFDPKDFGIRLKLKDAEVRLDFVTEADTVVASR